MTPTWWGSGPSSGPTPRQLQVSCFDQANRQHTGDPQEHKWDSTGRLKTLRELSTAGIMTPWFISHLWVSSPV